MKRLLALLLLAVAPAFAQEYTPGPYIPASPPTSETENLIYTTLNPPPEGTNYTWTGFINFNTGGGGLSGGNIPAYNSQTGTFIFGYAQGTVNYNLFDTSEFPANGTQINSFKYSWEYFNQQFSRGSLSANIRFYDPNNNILENFNFQLGQTTNGWTLFGGEIGFADPYDMSEIGRIQVSFTGKDDRFWAGYYGPQVRALDLSLTYGTAPPPTDFPYWERLAGENELFTLTEPGVVRYGADGVYIYQEFQPGTYACTNGDWGSDPIGGVVKSCDFGSNIPPPVAEVDCATDPTDPTCIIDSIINEEEPVMLAEETAIIDSSDDDEEESIAEELLAAADPIEEIETAVEEEALEELLADESLDEEMDMEEELVAETRELANEEKAATLADSISKDVLETALTVTVEVAASTSESASSESTKTSSSAVVVAVSESVSSESVAAAIEVSAESVKEETATESSSVAALDILETGRLLGQEALAVTLAGTEASAAESLAEAESIAAVSSSDSVAASAESVIETTAVVASNDTQETQTVAESSIESSVNEETTATESSQVQVADVSSETVETLIERTEETQTNQSEETLVAEVTTSTQQNQESTVEVQAEEVVVAETMSVETSVESNEMQVVEVQQEQQSAIEFTTVDQAMEVFANNITSQATEQEELENNIIQQAIASAQTEEENKMGFSEAEAVTIANDPALANAFNVGPSTTNLEILGVLGSKAEEKSDAEIRAEQVVAANKEQQDAINANYMDADQSGILVAIGSDTDVTSYRTAMIRDNNIWYKPEDIYKNIVYKDNVRGSYFLEKGNTDTYKKMVEEQYK